MLAFYGLEGCPPHGELWWLFIEPLAIGSGAGRALFEHAVASARELGRTSMRIEADPAAEGFYLRMGTVPIGEVPLGSIPGRSLLVLELLPEGALPDHHEEEPTGRETLSSVGCEGTERFPGRDFRYAQRFVVRRTQGGEQFVVVLEDVEDR